MNKPKINSEYPIDKLITERWSGRAYSSKTVEKGTLLTLFEAARWAPSSFNEQPWRFKVGVKGDDYYDSILNTLVEFNKSWAQDAPVLVMIGASKAFSKNGKTNRHYWYDTGQAMGNLSLQATKLDLNLHQMAGFDASLAQKELFDDPDIEPVCVMAIGYRAEPNVLPDNLAEKELLAQTRKPLAEIVDIL